jgi:tRNA(fMet)-specific endonuclease VapC
VAVILDTNAVSALFSGDAAIGEALESADRHHLPVVVIGEYRYGLLRSTVRKRMESLLQTLIHESVVLRIDEATAEIYADVRDQLRLAGRPIPENDVWIAALSRQHDEPVLSKDQHFDAVAGLDRRSW